MMVRMNRPTRRPRVLLLATVPAVVTMLGLTGCGGSTSSSSGSSSAASSSGSSQSLPITIKGSTITPTNKRIPVKLNEPLKITITADRSGELHLHSSPEQHLDFDKGVTVKTVTLSVPGVVELEEHATDTLIAQLEVR